MWPLVVPLIRNAEWVDDGGHGTLVAVEMDPRTKRGCRVVALRVTPAAVVARR